MGLAASQARLLSITARLTDNENTGQNLSTSKMRLADQTQQINADYMNALSATKLTVLTGFNGADAVYTDISYGLMTGYETVACGKQYVVTDTKGRILVTKEQEDAFNAGNGDLNVFLERLGYTQSDLGVTKADENIQNGVDTNEKTAEAKQKIHDAWDKYLTSIGKGFDDIEHGAGEDVVYGYEAFTGENGGGYPYYMLNVVDSRRDVKYPLNYEGTTQEQRALYDYAAAITKTYSNTTDESGLKSAYDADNKGMIQYLTNIFNKMASCGFYSYAQVQEKETIRDNHWFEEQIRKGELLLEYFDANDKKFHTTGIDSDTAIQEVEDERAVALVEAKYTMDMSEIENKDQKLDLELKKIDTEHNALQTEYDSVKSVVDKNVEKTFNIFS